AQNDGTATANPTTGTSPYTYQWDVSAGSQTTQTATGLAAGTYNVTVTDVSGCSATVSATVSSATAISLSTAVTDVSTIGGSDGSIDLAVSGGASPYTYNWSNGSTTEDISGLTAGNYCVTVSDTASCQDTVCVTVNEPVCSSFTISSTVTDVSTSGGSDGSIDITVSGGTTPYSYNWDNAATTEDISGLTSGAYCVTVTDTNACDTSICLIVNEPGCSGFSVTVSTTDATTVGGSDGTATANPTGGTSPYSYLWDANASSQTTQTATGLAAGSYCVTVTDNSSCVASACGTVSEPNCTAFSATATSTDATTTGGSDGTATANSASGTSPYSYLWDTNAGNQTTQTATGLSAGNYCVTVTDSVGCSATACVAVNEPSCSGFSANATATNATTTGGSDGTATANPTGGTSPYSYLWDANAGSQTTQTAMGLSAGNYCVTVTDSVNCQTTACTAVNDPGCAVTVSLTVTDVSVPNDSDGIIVATPSGGTTPYSYQWDANTGNQTTQTATGLAGGNYCVTVTDSAGCTAIACETVNDPGCPGFSADIQGTDVTLPGGSDGVATANPIGGTSPFTYQWDSNTGGQTTQTATGLSQGNYCVTITDGTGCLAVGCTQINEPSCNLTAIISVVNVTTPGGSNGAATVNTTGGTSPFTYLWDANTGSQITQTATGLSMGNYCVTVTDSTNCTATNCASIIEINCTNLLSDAGADTTITTGETITIGGSPTASGGIPAYAYDWSPVTSMDDPSSANPVISPTTTTTYIVVITDSAGCQSTDDITVTVTDPYYFVPNVFSPNGDGIHDMLFVEGKALENIRFTIYDRWGEKVFESNSLEVGWDGTYKGKEMNSTVFVYILEASLDGQTIKENGNITLVRY
ncbi:gliding motility-associated C-terminal domain-containing protein, partial [Bacteroidales bacterium AH-315-I05]|nr:gliding motility-associated C-terminal domain-containing protein [Bacteroidales bacterium AH-315-I05]